ncbi:MAG: hypothetical protein IT280_11475 [Ignavibacteria bacterium]|nr:hypothetical protein [Ignavibacteria bacterium]
MKFNLIILILLLNLYVYSQQSALFSTPPGNITLPSIITDNNSAPKSTGIVAVDSKWIASSQPAAISLLEEYSNSPDKGIRKIINDILLKANVSEELKNKLTIKFKSSGIEERGIDINNVSLKDDFAEKYSGDNLLMITKLFSTNNAVIEITESGAQQFNTELKNALSDGLRFGNKTETAVENKMIVEIQNLVFAYEYHNINIERLTDKELIVPLYYNVEIGINSISTMTVTEGLDNDLYVNVGSSILPKPVEFRISPVNPAVKFRVGGKEGYTIKYINVSGNKATFSLSGFNVKFQ